MTICAASLAADSKVIVCIADKALSYGDHIQWDSDSPKIVKLNPGSLIMFSGGEESCSRVLAAVIENADSLTGKARAAIIRTCESLYRESVDELVEAKFLIPRLLKRSEYISAITGQTLNKYVYSLARSIDKFKVDCELLVCGFDDHNMPFILSVSHPGIATDMTKTGFDAIGSGWDKAVSHLLFSNHERTHSVARTLYDSFDAKAYAEMAAGVGYEWDAVVAIRGPVGFCDISKEIKEIVERAWSKYNRSPFEKYDKKKDLPPPPVNWKVQLDALMESQVLQTLARMEAEIDAQKKRKK